MAARPIEVGPVGRHVAARLARARRALSLTQADLSRRLDAAACPLPVSALSRIEKLDRRISVDDLVALATALNLDPADLLQPDSPCGRCDGSPPAGYACLACGAAADPSAEGGKPEGRPE